MNKILIIVALLLLTICSKAQTGYNFTCKYGIADSSGKIIASANYELIYPSLNEKPTAAMKDGKWGFVNKAGKEVIPFVYDYITNIVYKKNGYYGRSTASRDVVYETMTEKPIEVSVRAFFTTGLEIVSKNDKWGIIDERGNVTSDFVYDKIQSVSDNFYLGYIDDKCSLIGANGKVLTSDLYDGVAVDNKNGTLAQVKKNGKYGAVNAQGKLVIPIIYDDLSVSNPFVSTTANLIVVTKGDKVGFVDTLGQKITPIIYDNDTRESHYFRIGPDTPIPVSKKDKWGLIDRKGKEIVAFQYDRISRFSEGMALVSKDGRRGYIDAEGKEIIPFLYDGATNFNNGVAEVEIGGRSGLVDKTGKLIVPCEYDYVIYPSAQPTQPIQAIRKDIGVHYYTHSGQLLPYQTVESIAKGLYRVSKEDKVALVDSLGNELGASYNDITGLGKYLLVTDGRRKGINDYTAASVLPIEYDAIEYPSKRLFAVKKDGRWGFVNTANKMISLFAFQSYKKDIGEGIISVKRDNKWGAIDTLGNLVIATEYNHPPKLVCGVFGVAKQKHWGLMGSDGKKITDLIYSCPPQQVMDAKLLAICKDDKLGLLDVKGKEVCPFVYDKFRRIIDNDVAIGVADGKLGFYSFKTKYQSQFVYDHIDLFIDGLSMASKDGACGVIDMKGETVVPFEYEKLKVLKRGNVLVYNNNGWHTFDKKTKQLTFFAHEIYENRMTDDIIILEAEEVTHRSTI